MTDRSQSPAARRGHPAIIWLVKVLVSGGLLYWLFQSADATEVWRLVRTASLPWLAFALVLYLAMILVSAWRWGLLLHAQRVAVPLGALTNSFLVATFFNNFLPSNIGGDVIRVRDTARASGSRTVAATVVILDRGLGLLGLIFVAALGATLAARRSEAIGPVGPGLLWAALGVGLAIAGPALLMPQRVGQLLHPLRALHREWVSNQIERLTTALARFRSAPRALVQCFTGAICVQLIIVSFYAAIAHALRIPIPMAHLAILIPVSFIVQLIPVSVNGFGVREGVFSSYFLALHLPTASALALSLSSAFLIMIFSVSGAVAYVMRRQKEAVAELEPGT